MEPEAIETAEAVQAHIQALHRFARALLRSEPHRVDDLVQDAIERALTHWHRRRHDGNLRNWLLTILYNRFITDQRRRRHENLNRSLDTIPKAELPGFQGGQEPALAYRDLLRGFAELPQEQRAVMLLITDQDLSYGEAARLLGIPIGTVMSRLSRGRERLRRYMNDGPPKMRAVAATEK